jgi:uncharacterized protein (TIGR03435 family)
VYDAYAGREQPLRNTVVGQLPWLPASVRGGPSWAHTDTFAIEAKGEAISAATLTPMLRALLEDRFQVKVRRLTETADVYAMTVAKGGINTKMLRTPTPGDCQTSDERKAALAATPRPTLRTLPPICGGRSLNGDLHEAVWSSLTMPEIAAALPGMHIDHYVIDQTGIDGTFNITWKWSPDDPVFPPVDPGWIMGELGKMGLKLTRTKAPAEYLQIDHAEKPQLK